MNNKPGRVERAILQRIEQSRAQPPVTISTMDLLLAAFGIWMGATKSQRISVRRAMRRIAAREPHWTVERRGVRVFFRWSPPVPPPPPPPPQPKVKPQKVREEIWACVPGLRGRRDTWSRAIITSRGGAGRNRVTVEWENRKWQCTEYRDGSISAHHSTTFEELRAGKLNPQFCHEHARPRIEQEQREFRRRDAAMFGGTAGASNEALTMLGLSRPFTRADVQRQFKAKAMKVHPDQGGDHDIMITLTMARDAALAEAEG